LRESYISFSPSAGFLEANKNGILESSNFTWTYYALPVLANKSIRAKIDGGRASPRNSSSLEWNP
jgi:hypothetical protein